MCGGDEVLDQTFLSELPLAFAADGNRTRDLVTRVTRSPCTPNRQSPCLSTRESFLRVFQFHHSDHSIADGTRTRKAFTTTETHVLQIGSQS